MMEGANTPFLDGSLLADARDALGDLSHAYLMLHMEETPAHLSRGHAANALLHAYLAPIFEDRDHAARASESLRAALSGAAQSYLAPALFGGFVGIAWALEHICGDASAPPEEDSNIAIDEVLDTHLAHSPWTGDFELIGGLVGVGVYALERLPRGWARRALETIVERLGECAIETPEGITWEAPPRRSPLHVAEHGVEMRRDVGVAHGVPGVIAFLAAVSARGVGSPKAARLLEGAVRWTLSQAAAADGGFPYWRAAGMMPRRARAAWCYGEPGIAVALLLAARAANEAAWEREALAIAQRGMSRSMADAEVRDASLCHGAFGLGHVYRRIHAMTNDASFAAHARACFAQGLAFRRPGQGLAGFPTWTRGDSGEFAYVRDDGFLTGEAGIALALASAVSGDDAGWDRALLLSHA